MLALTDSQTLVAVSVAPARRLVSSLAGISVTSAHHAVSSPFGCTAPEAVALPTRPSTTLSSLTRGAVGGMTKLVSSANGPPR